MNRKQLSASWGIGTPYEQSVRNFRLRENEGLNKPQYTYTGDSESRDAYLDKQDDDYGITDWAKDTWSEFFQDMNKAQADDMAGQWQRAQEKIDIAKGAAEEIKNDMKIDALNSYFSHRRKGLNTAGDIKVLQQLYPNINFNDKSFEKKLLSESDKLILNKNHNNYDLLIKDMQSSGMGVLADLKHKLGIWMHDNNDDESNSVAGYMQDWVGDRVTDASGKLAGIDGVSNKEKLQMLQNYQKQLSDVQKYSKRAQEANEKESKWYENAHKVSEYYKNRIERSQRNIQDGGSMWTIDNLLYANTQQMGFSSSSWDKLGASMLLSIAAGVATGGTSTAMQVTGAGLGVAGAMAQYSAGQSENNAQAIEDLKTRVTNQLKKDGLYDKVVKEGKKSYKDKSDDEIMDMIAHGDYLPQNSKSLHSVSKAITDSLEKSRAGISANFERNQYAVASDAMVDMLLFSGKGFKAIGSAIAKATNTAAKFTPIKQAGKWVMDRIGNGVGRAYEFGVKTGTGIGGGITAAGVRATGNIIDSALRATPKEGLIRNAMAWSEREVNAGRKMFGKLIAKTHAKDAAKDLIRQKRLDKFVKKPAGFLSKVAISGYSEAIEEGKQYLNGQQWIENEDPERVIGFFDGVMRDMQYGSKLIIPALGVPFGARWGIADKGELYDNLYANMAGGWLGGAMHTAIVSGAADAIGMMTTPDKISVAQAIAQNYELDRANSISRFTKGSNLIEIAHNDPNQTKTQLEYLKQFNYNRRKLGLSNIDDQTLNEEEEYIDKLTRNAKNPILNDALDDADIQKGTKEWFDAISAYTMYNELSKEDESAMKEVQKQLPSAIQDVVNVEVDDEDAILNSTIGATVNPLVSIVNSINAKQEAEQIKNRTEAEKQNKIAAEHGDEEAKKLIDAQQEEDAEAALNASVASEKKGVVAPTLTINDAIGYIGELKALQELKDDVTVADDYSEKNSHHDATFFKNKIQERIDQLKKKLDVDSVQLQKVLDDPTAYIANTEKFEDLKSLYKKQISAKINRDVSDAFIKMLTGQPNFEVDKETKKLIQKGWHLSKAKDLIKKLNNAANSDYDTIDRLNNEYEQSVNGTSAVQQATQAQQPQQSAAPAVASAPIQTNATVSAVDNQVASATAQLDQMLEESIQYDYELSPDNIIDPELDKIGSVLMNAAFVNGKYSWKDAVAFVYDQLKKYNFSDRKISMAIPFLKQWYMAEQMLSIYDNIDQFSPRSEVIATTAQDIIDDLTFNYDEWIERKKKELGVNFIVPSIEVAVGTGGILDAQYKKGDTFGIIYDNEVIVYTVTKVDKDGNALDIDDEFGNPLCRDGNFLTKEQLELLKTGFTPEQSTISKHIEDTLSDYDSNIEDSTSHDLFVRESDGKLHLYTRSFYVTGEQFEEEASKTSARNTAYNKILDSLRNNDRESLKDITITFEQRHNQYATPDEYVVTRKLSDLKDLKKYLNYLDQFDSNTDNQYVEVAEALSNLLVEDEVNPSLVVSQIVIELAKHLFNTNVSTIQSVDYNTFQAEVFGNKYNINAFISKSKYDELVTDLKSLADYYQNTLHYKVMPLDHTLYAKIIDQNGKEHRVSGQNAFVAIDQFGKTHLLNLTSSSYTFIKELSGNKVGPMFDPNRKLFNKYESKRSSIDQYGMKMSLQAQLFCSMVQNVELADHPIELIPIHLKYNYKAVSYNYNNPTDITRPGIEEIYIGKHSEPLRVILPTTSNIFDQIQFYEDLYDDIFPRIDERCNLLTTIKEELQTVLYNLNSLKNSNNQQTLNKVAALEQRVTEYISRIDDCINTAYEVCNTQQLDTVNLMISTMFDNLDDVNALLTQTQIEDVQNSLSSEGLTEENEQFAPINKLMQDIANRYKTWVNDQSDRQAGQKIWQDCNELLNLVQEFKDKYPNSKYSTECTRAEQMYLHIKNLQPVSSIHNMRASRIRDGYGFTNYNTVELYYQQKAVATDGSGVTLSEVCGEPEFAEQSVTFISGRPFRSKAGKPGTLIPITIEYKGKIFNVMLRLADNQHGQSLMMKISNLLNTKKQGERIVLTGMDRTLGRPNNTNHFVNVTNSMLVPSGIDYSDIKMDTTMKDGERSFTIGLTKHYIPSNPNTPVVIVDREGQVQYTFPKVIDTAGQVDNGGTAGKLYVVMTPDYRNKSMIPEPMVIPIQNMNYNDDEVNYLISLFRQGMNDKVKLPRQDGLYVQTDLTYKDLISMFIPYGKWRKDKPATRVMVSGAKVTFTFGQDNQQTPGTKEFDMNSNDPEFGLPGLVKYLKTQRFHISKELLYAETADKDNKVFRTIKTFFKDNKGEQKVRFGNTRMQFDRSDFENGGMSGLAWMMKHEMLMTDVDKFVDPRFSYNDISVESDPTVTAPVSTPAPSETTDSFDNIDYTEYIQDSTPEFYDNSLHIAMDGEEAVNKEEAELHIEQIFGKNVKKEVVDNYVRIIRDFPPGYAGRCFRDMIYVSTRAVKGTEYHEAFHRVYRLLLTEKQRNKLDKSILKIYEKKYGKEAAKVATRKDLNEFAADKCQRYFVHHGNVEFSIRGIFDFIKDCYKAYKQIGSLRLYWLFMQMNRGKFVDKEILEENRDALSTIADDARGPLTIHGKSFKHVVSKRQYNTLLRSLYYYINIGFGIKEDLSNIDDLNLTKEELLKKRTIKFKARWSRHEGDKHNLTGYENFLKKKYPDGKLPNGKKYVVPEEDSVVTKVDPKTGIREDVYDEVETSIAELILKKCTTSDALQEMIDKFDEVVKYDLIKYLKELGINYKTEADHTYEKMMRAGDIALDEDERGWLDVLLKDTFEQSQVSRATSNIKRLMSLIKDYKLNDHGKYVPVRNECGLFEYIDHKDVLNMVFSDCMRIKTPEEMMAVFERKKNEGNHIYRQIYEIIYPFYKHQKNANNEQIVTQLFNLVASTQNKFKTLLAHREGKGDDAYYVHTVKDCGQEYEAREFKKTWGRMLFYSNNGIFRKNEDGNFVPVDNESISKIGKVFDALQSIKEFFNDKNIRAVTEAYEDVPVLTLNIEHLGIKDHYINMDNDNDLNILKKDVCLMLNSIGIQFSYNEFEFMLSQKYGEHNTILDNLNNFFNQTGDSDIAKLWQNASDVTLLKKTDSGWDINFKDNVITSNNGRKIPVEDVYDHNAFVGEIANYKYQYRHKFEDMAVLVTNNKRYYTISENNLITDVTDEISKYGQVAQDLSKYCFNVYKDEDGNLSGSLILKEADNCHKLGKQLDINVCTLTQFKTDETKNEGHDYFDISEVEDYLAKSTILRDGHIIFPTMSDKKTWVYIDGVILPGLKYSNVWNAKENKNELVAEQQFDVAIDQLIEYAFAEYKSVKQTIKQVNDLAKNHPERMVLNFHTNFVTSKSYSTLEQALKVDSNVHYITDSDVEKIKAQFDKNKGKEEDGNVTVPLRNKQVKVSKKWDEDSEKYKYSISYNVPNGCMFGSFNGIHTKDGYINFNTVFDKEGRFISPEMNLQKAEKLFFGDHISNQTLADADGNKIEGRRAIIRRAISEQTDEELEHVVELGLITYDESTGLYANRGLDNESLKAVDRMLGHDAFNPEVSMSKAIRTYIADTVIKSIMSINEVERVYAGNPAFFKFKYGVDEEGNTVLMNRSVDEFKRLGGLISTGVNNNLSIKGIPSDGMYNCAIINDVEVSSKQMDTIDRLMGEAEWRSAYKALTKTKFEEPKYDPELTTEQNEEIYQRYREYVKDSNNKKDDDSNSMSLDDIKEYIEKYHKQTYDIIVAKIKAETKSYHDGINVADGAAYISPEMTEWLLRMCGNYDKKVQKAFEILKDPKSDIYSQAKAYKLVTTKVIGAQKYTAYGQRLSEDGQTMIPYYNKMALFPVFKCIATGQFAKIYDRMQKNTDDKGNPAPVHMLMMESAVKIGAQGILNYGEYDDSDRALENSVYGKDDFKFHTFKQSFKYLRKQFNTDPHHQEDQAMGTQMVKVALASLLENHKYITENGEELRGYELLDQIMSDINSLARDGYQNIEQEFFKEDGTLDIVKFSQFLHENLTSRDSDQSLIESIETVARISPDGTKYYTMNHPLAATSRVAWLQSILASRINEKVVDVNTKGSAFYQRSIFGMEGATVISDKNAPKDLNGGKELKMIIEDGPAKGAMDCVLTIDYFADILEKAGLQNAPFEEQKKALINSGIVGPNAKASLIGYRIPTQAQSSIHALRCVDVLPVIQHTIILPKEFTKITGSDFDIDKIFIGSLDYDIDENWTDTVDNINNLKHYNYKEGVHYEDRDGKIFIEKEDIRNRLIKNYLTILKDESSTHIAHRSIDNDTTLLTDLLKKIESKQVAKKPYRVYDFYSLRTQTKTKNEFITGKTGIGPFALNNNSQILTMLYGVEFAKNTIMDRLGHASLHRTSDDYGNSIMSWISALINAHVDIAKDPYITRLNVNPMTYNLVNLMIRTGYGDDTFYFTTQPIMKKMAEKYTQSSSEFMKDPNKSVYEIRKECKRNAALEVCGEEEIEWAEELLLDERGNLKLEYDRGSSIPRVDASQVINSLFSNKILEKISIDGIVEDDAIYQIDMPDGTPQMITGKKVQALVYVIDKLFETPAQKLADVVKYSKIDTKKQGKNITEQLAYARGVEKTFGDMTLMKEIYGEYVPNEDEVQNLDNFYFNRGLTEMYEKSFIKAKTHLAIGLYSRVLKDQVIEAAPAFQRLVSRIASLLNSEGDKDISKISQAVSDKLKSEYFIQYAKDNNIDIQGLVTGENTIYDRLLSIQYKITSGEFGQEAIDTDGTPSNTLLKLLIADNNTVYNPNSNTNNNQRVDRFKNLKFVRLFNALDLDSAKTDAIIQAWEDLLEDPNEEIRTFARDLCVYAFFTSGDKGGRTKLFQYVPNKFRTNFDTENSYVNFIRDLLVKLQSQAWCESMLNSPNFIDDIALNNYTDNTFVKQYKLTEEDTSEGTPIKWIKLDTLDSVRQQHPDVDQTHYPVLVSTQDYINKEDAPMYFKTYRSKYKDSFHRCVTVYKRIGFKEAEGNPDMIIPIYAKVNPRGYTTGGYNFYEYGDVYQSNPDPEFAIDVNKWAKFPLDYKIAAYASDLLEKFLTMIRTFRGGTSVERRTSGLDGVYAPEQPVTIQNPEYVDGSSINTLQDRGASEKEEQDTIESNKTILSNEELAEWNKQGVGPNPRILVADERTDPAFFANQIIDLIEGRKRTKNKYKYTRISAEKYATLPDDKRWYKKNGSEYIYFEKTEIPNSGLTGHDFAGLYIITKHDGMPIKKILQTKIPKLIHFSITGLGNTKWEPGVMKADDLLDRIQSLIKNDGLDPNMVTIRIDPIVPGVTTKDMIEHIVQRASSMGIKRIRFSVMDCYNETEKAMTEKGYDFSKYYNRGTDKFHAKPEVLNAIADFMLTLKEKYGITLGTCAEPLVKEGISQEGCLSVDGVNRMLGTSLEDKGKDNNKYRKECSCFGGKVDALSYNDKCASSCVYCYARHNTDKALNYYNEDGTLKDVYFTRTEETTSTNNTPDVNIHYGSNENKDLSNFAERPFAFTSVFDFNFSTMFKTVEGAFQAQKLNFTDYYDIEQKEDLEKEFANAIGEQARSKGRSIKGLDKQTWDEQSSSIMKQLLLESFKQNPQALKALLATGDAKLTHLSKAQQKMTPEQLAEAKRKDKWIEEFPRLLMEVRSELKDYKSEKDGIDILNIFDSEGNINWDKFDEFQRRYFESQSDDKFKKGRYNLSNRPEHHEGEENTLQHLKNVYKSILQIIEGPQALTEQEKLELKLMALFHDFGKPFRNTDHGLDSYNIAKELLGEKISKEALFAIRWHMLEYIESDTITSDNVYQQMAIDIKNNNLNLDKVFLYLIALNWSDILRGRQLTDIDPVSKRMFSDFLTEEILQKTQKLSNAYNSLEQQSSPSSTDTIFGADGLTDEQRNAKDNTLDYIIKTINGKQESNKPYALIQGKAGTGKTFVVQYIIKELKKKHPGLRIAVAALSRKAVHVLADKTVSLGAKTESLYTLAGANPNVGEDRFAIDPEKQRFSKYDVIFIDECSMITPGFQATIDQYKMDNPDLAIVFLGDKGQLRGVDTKKSVTKAPIFERSTVVKSELNTRIRQGEDSPILSYADPYWEVSMGNSNQDVNKIDSGFSTVISEKGSVIFESGRQVIRKAIPAFKEAVYSKNPNHIKIVAGKNETVDMYNEAIHNALFPDAEGQFAEGDLVIYNQPYGGKEGVENSTEGVVTHVSDAKFEYTDYGEIKHYIVQVKVDGGTIPTLVIDKNDNQSKKIFSKIVDEAYQNALRLRTKGAWKHYYDTKDKFADLKYAYSITTHKSQGSTYDITVVDGMDISSMPWSPQQIAEAMYTAITRSKDTTVMISSNKKSDINVEEYANDMTKVKNEPISPSDPRTEENASYSKYGKLTGWKDKTTYTAAQAREAYSKMPNRFDKLADWAFTAAEKLGITYIVDNGRKTSEGRTVAGSSDRTAPVIYLNLEGLRAGTLLHETIHATTRYWIDNFENAPIKIKKALSYLKSSYDEILEQYITDTVAGYDRLSKDKKNSVREKMQKYYASVAGDVYGLSSFYEFIAEMSNHKLVALIQQMDADQEKKKNILQRIVEGIMRILHLTAAPEVKNESIMRNIAASLQYVITNVDANKYQDNIQRWRDILDGNREEGQNPLFDNQVVKKAALEQLQKVENGERIGTEYDAATLLRSMSLATQINGVLTTAKTIEVSMFNTFFSQSKNEERTIEYKRRQPVESITEEQLNAVLYNHGMAHITTNIDRAGRITFVSNQNDTYTTDSVKDMLNKDYDDNIQGKC